MTKVESLILLIHSLTKTERKKLSVYTSDTAYEKDYLLLFKLIEKNKNAAPLEIKSAFHQERPYSSFNTSVSYLYEIILKILAELRKEQDYSTKLFHQLANASILYEKSLYEECFTLIRKLKKEAIYQENYFALLMLQRQELDYLLNRNFPEISEQKLLNKQLKINDTLKIIRKINEQKSLYELLKHRTFYKGNVRSQRQKLYLNDLVVSEMSLVASFGFENFEIKKMHQLFQANYLISVGDYKAALHSFYELLNLFESKKHLWNHPPNHYVLTIEGILESLRSIRNYREMGFFIEKLRLLDSSSVHFQTHVQYIIYIYELFAALDNGDFATCITRIEKAQTTIYDKINYLPLNRQAELSLYTALCYLGNHQYNKARKTLSSIIFNNRGLFTMPLYRTIRLVNLMVYYEMKDFDYILYEIRSIKREIQKEKKGYRIESIMLNFISKTTVALSAQQREKMWKKTEPLLNEVRNNKYEQQILRQFDFTAWIESKLKRLSLQEVLEERNLTESPTSL